MKLYVVSCVDIVIENIMSVGGKQSSLRKAIGAIKDTTTVSLAKVHSGYKVCCVNDLTSCDPRLYVIVAI